MNRSLDYTNTKLRDVEINISGSKSESNRLLILKQWFPNLSLHNLSDSDDTHHLRAALTGDKDLVDIGHAGTAMRFLTAYFSLYEGKEVTLTGSERMQQRPVKILVDALKSLGAQIEYVNNEGYPPLKISGVKIRKKRVRIKGNVSSQYISALLLVAPALENGLEVELIEEITSRPYLQMTLDLLEQIGVSTSWKKNLICIEPKSVINNMSLTVESDWSSASYFYSIVALSEIGSTIELTSYKKESLQGDSCLATIYEFFGVGTTFFENSIRLTKVTLPQQKHLELNLKNAPDIAQTIAVTCFAMRVSCDLTGLHTLKIKETDRLEALRTELEKFGASIKVSDKSLHLKAAKDILQGVSVATYNDHRMAMAFAPLALRVPLVIENAEVVTKSYINFWEDLSKCLY